MNQLVRALLLTLRNDKDFEQFSLSDQNRLEEILQFVGGEEVDALLDEFDNFNELHYQIKMTLKGAKPPIWRRVIVPANYTFEELHLVIQEAMGWMDMHLYNFEYGNLIIDDLGEDDLFDEIFMSNRETLDATEIMIGQILQEEGEKCLYTYDFGDDWEHTIELEKILPFDEELRVPICIKGKRACPPEDCGGMVGFKDMLTILAGPNDENKSELLDWLGEDFNPEAFDIELVNKDLKILGEELSEPNF